MQQTQEYGHPCRLYLISPPHIENVEAFETQLREAFSGGDVGAFQLRLKDAADAEIFEAARACQKVCNEHEVAFVLNDRPDIGAEIGADCVHMGQEDLEKTPLEEVRRIIGPEIAIGVSCHDSSHLAMEAGDQGADYVAFGAFYETKSKEPEQLAKYGTPEADILEWWSTYTVLPCVAIGGMNAENCAPMAKAGADFIACITAVWEHSEGPAAGVKAMNMAIREALNEKKQETSGEAA